MYGGFGQGGFGGGFTQPGGNRGMYGQQGRRGGSGSRRRRDPWDEAREANERRRDDIKRMLKKRRREVMGKISGMGKAGMADIDREFTGLSTKATQDLASRGLSGTTVAPTVQASVAREKGAAIGSLRERLAGLRAGYLSDLMGDEASFMERIEDEYPDYSGY